MLVHFNLRAGFSSEEVISIVKDAVAVDKVFWADARSILSLGLNNNSTESNIEFVANKLLTMLNCPKIRHSTLKLCETNVLFVLGILSEKSFFSWISSYCMGKETFFELKMIVYRKFSVSCEKKVFMFHYQGGSLNLS